MIDLRFESVVAGTPEAVFAHATTMAGVNQELGPWVRMTHPADRAELAGQQFEPGAVLVHRVLLAGGIVPIDRHARALERILEGPEEYGFDEESTSLLQRRWRHEGRIVAVDGGSSVTDDLAVEPRVSPVTPIVRRIVAAIFRHRHRRLARRFGTPSGHTT